MNRRIVKNNEDCADCLCRVCTNNAHSDCLNPKVPYGYATCIPCEFCRIGETLLVEIENDCPTESYLPDIEDCEGTE